MGDGEGDFCQFWDWISKLTCEERLEYLLHYLPLPRE
jgi:hypothetical protein